jgi:hypothetical protein
VNSQSTISAADYLTGRQNPSKGSHTELNAKLAAIVASFSEAWLTQAGASPLQRLWARIDGLATVELLNFGDAVERMRGEDPVWLAGQVKIVKGKDLGNAAGAIFEILGLNLFSRDWCSVIPAPAAKPGFDGTLALNDGSRVLVSIKNHGMSSYEQQYRSSAARLDTALRNKLRQHGLRDAELRVLMNVCPDKPGWDALRRDVEAMVADTAAGGAPAFVPNGPWILMLKSIDAKYQPTSRHMFSSSCQLLAPHHKNEQDKFVGDIEKGCANMVKHTNSETGDDVCRMIVLRLSATASIAVCVDWAKWYFGEHLDSPLSVILLYQTAVVDDASGQSSVTHFLLPVTGPRFDVWKKRADGSVRRLPPLSIFVGSVATSPPALAISDGIASTDISAYYAYQRADIYKAHNPMVSSWKIDIGSPAPGVTIRLMLESPGMPSKEISAIGHSDRTLELLP